MQPSSQNIPRGGIYPFQKINRKFDFRSACNKIPKTTAFTCILTLILGISYIKSHFFYIWVEFTFSKWNLILQSGIYFFNSPFFFSSFSKPLFSLSFFCFHTDIPLFCIFLYSSFIKIVSLAVNHYDNRKVLYLQLSDCLCP